jgi:hypothetical protein
LSSKCSGRDVPSEEPERLKAPPVPYAHQHLAERYFHLIGEVGDALARKERLISVFANLGVFGEPQVELSDHCTRDELGQRGCADAYELQLEN